MTELEQNLQRILEEKENKILPENIKEGVQIYNVIGTFRGGDPAKEAQIINLLEDINGEII